MTYTGADIVFICRSFSLIVENGPEINGRFPTPTIRPVTTDEDLYRNVLIKAFHFIHDMAITMVVTVSAAIQLDLCEVY